MPGTLFVVATPIGNLEDLTFRALRTLKEVDLIAAEDTRRSSKLLAHYGISKPLVSLREHNEAREGAKLVARLEAGRSVALVSDAGTPAIADPGARLVRAARTAGIKIVPVPGPSAVTAAISVAGLDSTEFAFVGFPPSARLARRRWVEQLKILRMPLVLLEAPHRIVETLSDVGRILVNRPIIVFRELTKINEEYVIRPKYVEGIEFGIKDIGEFTVVIGSTSTAVEPDRIDQSSAVRLFEAIIDTGIVNDARATEAVAAALSIEVSLARKAIKKGKISAKQRSQSVP